jgi:hypothetical protein
MSIQTFLRDASNGRMALSVANRPEPLLIKVQAMGDIKPVGTASAKAKVLAPAIKLKFCLIKAIPSRQISMAGSS